MNAGVTKRIRPRIQVINDLKVDTITSDVKEHVESTANMITGESNS